MGFWKETFLIERRKEWLKSIVKAQYLVGSNWYDAIISEKKIVGNTLYLNIIADAPSAMTITKVRLIEVGGTVAGEKVENILKKSTQGVLLQLTFPIYEIET